VAEIEKLYKEHFQAFFDLVLKCRSLSYEIVSASPSSDSRTILKRCELVSPKGGVPADIQKLVLNIAQGEGTRLTLVYALKDRVSPVETSKPKPKKKCPACIIL
jgi:hypothetical protein